mmetsp:Transcript_27166/g.22803  ORF Transcript_27166/g.22803 Transcript_27166/m.22803 type:complete len:242 (+) Transcript_27166:210-935(+)
MNVEDMTNYLDGDFNIEVLSATKKLSQGDEGIKDITGVDRKFSISVCNSELKGDQLSNDSINSINIDDESSNKGSIKGSIKGSNKGSNKGSYKGIKHPNKQGNKQRSKHASITISIDSEDELSEESGGDDDLIKKINSIEENHKKTFKNVFEQLDALNIEINRISNNALIQRTNHTDIKDKIKLINQDVIDILSENRKYVDESSENNINEFKNQLDHYKMNIDDKFINLNNDLEKMNENNS